MRVLSAKEIRLAEERCFQGEFTEAGLMNSAGTACFKKIIKKYGEAMKKGRTAVLCGNGKNAGDGFVIAELMLKAGLEAEIVLADRQPELAEPLLYFNKAIAAGVSVFSFEAYDFDCDFIVDCLFGIGFKGAPRAPFDAVIEAVNASGAVVISIDTPSGTDATTGEAVQAVKADYTIAISTLKYAHILPPANACCGEISVVNIGIPDSYYDECLVNTITDAEVRAFFSKREKNAHKGTYGRLLNICGSQRMCGAAVICAQAALKTGVGLLKCAFPKSIYPVMTAHLIQPLFRPLCENESKTLSIGAVNDLFEELSWADCAALGCGLGNNDDTQVIVGQLIKNSEIPIVLDADGINAAAAFIDIIRDRKAPLVITPHPAEMARLIGESTAYVQQNRITAARAFAQENDCVVVLKGANTIVTDGRRVSVNMTGNPGMAMGGTGDMLTGMIASFIAQGLPPFDAARAGVYIHGLCGDITARELSQRGMTIEDMLELLGALMSNFE